MKIIFDSPQPIEKLRKIYNDRVKFITNTSIWPMVEAIELNGDYLSGMRKREVPVKVGKKVDKLIDKYASRLKAVWAAYQKELASTLRIDALKRSSVTEDLAKDQDAPTLAQVEAEEDPSRRQVLMVQYLKARKDRLIKPKLEDMKQDLKRAALPMFSAVYALGKQRGQILTSQQIDDDLTPEDQKNLEEKEDWNDEFIDNLVDDAYAKYSDALEGDYENEDELYSAFQDAHKKEEHRLPLFAAALGSVLLGAGMAQAMKDVQEIDPETGEPTGEPKTDENGLPLGEVILGGYWHTSHDDKVCDGCENNDGFWMTVDEYQAEVGTNDCITNCRCPELFEPAERPDDEGQVWQGTPGMDKSVHSSSLSKEWDEAMHPRDEDGKFSESGGTAVSGSIVEETIRESYLKSPEGVTYGKTWTPVKLPEKFSSSNLDETSRAVSRATGRGNKERSFKILYNPDTKESYIAPSGREHSDSLTDIDAKAKIGKDWTRLEYYPVGSVGARGSDSPTISVAHWDKDMEYESGTPYAAYMDTVADIISNRSISDDTILETWEAFGVRGMRSRLGDLRSEKFESISDLAKFLKAEWREELHPRDDDGKFSESGGGGKPDIGADKPETHVPEKLTNVEGLKQWLGSGTKLIVSAERAKIRPEENYRRSVGLKRILENHAGEIVMQTGHYGGKERSYLAAPNSNEDADSLVQMALSPKEGEQEAIIVIRDGVAEMKYADKRPSEYALVSEMKEAPEATDFYSEIGGIKYQLDFRYKEKPNG